TQTRITDDNRHVLLAKDAVVNREVLDELPAQYWGEINVGDARVEEELARIVDAMKSKSYAINSQFDAKIERLSAGDELAPGVIKMVKVFVAIKRRLQVGDKMAGRHGNKGVVSKIVPEEDMPFLEDGTPVEICLNPLGVPSRMNVGQILETHLGWAAKILGRNMWERAEKGDYEGIRALVRKSYKGDGIDSFADGLDTRDLHVLADKARRGIHVATPVFDGASEDEIFDLVALGGLSITGQEQLRDGKSGERFDMPVTVGVMYMLKLHHLVDDKIHARSTGPYSLVTQQPLGGKAQFGGQRL